MAALKNIFNIKVSSVKWKQSEKIPAQYTSYHILKNQYFAFDEVLASAKCKTYPNEKRWLFIRRLDRSSLRNQFPQEIDGQKMRIARWKAADNRNT